MTEQELAKFKDNTLKRLEKTLNMSYEQAYFVVCLTRHTHSTLGAALYEINDYLDILGL